MAHILKQAMDNQRGRQGIMMARQHRQSASSWTFRTRQHLSARSASSWRRRRQKLSPRCSALQVVLSASEEQYHADILWCTCSQSSIKC